MDPIVDHTSRRIQLEAFCLGDWTVSPQTNEISSASGVKSLQPLSMDILVYLSQRPGEVVSAEELLGKFWERRMAGDEAVYRRIADLRKKLGDDARHPRYIDTVPKKGYRLVASVESTIVPQIELSRQPRWMMLALIGVVVASGFAWWWAPVPDATRALAIANAERRLNADDYQGAFAALLEIESGKDSRVDALRERTVASVSVTSSPAGVNVSYRYAGADSAWVDLGVTPIREARLPMGLYKLNFADTVFLNATNPGITFNNVNAPERIVTMPDEAVPQDMAYVPMGRFRLGAWGSTEEVELGGFLIDRLEVTNRQFLEFVERGGYSDQALWQPLIDASDGVLSWPLIAERLVDQTGVPGPRYWEFGGYPSGSGDFPVVGVTWYEASAFLRAQNKVLPTMRHWFRATLGEMEWKYPYAPGLVPYSNIGADRVWRVGHEPRAEAHGVYDLIGNVSEWSSTDSLGMKQIVGASFRDPAWSYNFPKAVDLLLATADLGFRGMRLGSQFSEEVLPEVPLFKDFAGAIKSVSDESFDEISHLFDYDEGSVRWQDATTLSETVLEHSLRRRILLPTDRKNDPLPVDIYLPLGHKPPYQSVFYLPPADSWAPGAASSKSIKLEDYQIDFLPRSGRTLIWPVYTGSHERYDGLHAASGAQRSKIALERNRHIRDEIGRVIDYLTSDSQFDGSRIGLIGLSHGAIAASFCLATESRIKAAVLYSIGIAPPIPLFASPENDPNVFWARVQQPTLILNGRYDPLRPQHYVLGPLLDLLATSAGNKKTILYDSGHWPLPRNQMMIDTHAWLNTYLGPVQSGVSQPPLEKTGKEKVLERPNALIAD